MNAASEPIAAPPDLTPLVLKRQADHLRFALLPQEDILAELPTQFEELLRTRLADILREPAPLTADIDLQSVPGLNSRQLGSLIALGKVLRPRFGPVEFVGVSLPVRNLLRLTRLEELFKTP